MEMSYKSWDGLFMIKFDKKWDTASKETARGQVKVSNLAFGNPPYVPSRENQPIKLLLWFDMT